jgi:hypothetical protein
MPLPKELQFKSGAKYTAGAVYQYSDAQRDSIRAVLQSPDIYVNLTTAFSVKYLDIGDKYVLPPVRSDEIVNRWNGEPMRFWQNQLNFAVWCATSGCGVSVQDHLLSHYDFAPESRLLALSIFRFHVYYQTRKILKLMQCPLPSEDSWNAFDNPINMTNYQLICNEFDIEPSRDWRQHQSGNNGLGQMRQLPSGVARTDGNLGSSYTPGLNGFSWGGSVQVKIDHIGQEGEAMNAWVRCMLDQSIGFTRAGAERLNDTIRTYVWAILGAQSEMRTSILGIGSAFDAQKRFLSNLELAIAQADVTSVTRYQSMLQYARSKLDFVLGEALYLCPSDMNLAVGIHTGYNNEIQVATVDMTPGANRDLNTAIMSPAHPSENDQSQQPQPVKNDPTGFDGGSSGGRIDGRSGGSGSRATHQDIKTAITVGIISIGVAYFLLR